jgi:methionyl-tRNA synthetase
MSAARVYISTTIPYVNGRPHLGHALELVQADVLARHHRLAGDQVRFQTGTDDNSLKNVLAARAEGVSTRELVDRNASAFAELRGPLGLSFDDFIRTSSDPRHRPGVERLWRACAASGDLYRRYYEGLYCVGCEQFYRAAELPGGRCPEHGTEPQRVAEENWFFRLSRYAGQLHELISSGRLAIEPAARRNEVLGFIAGGLEDFSASRSTARARGWGIPVPGDPGQVVYVWWDALGNYITSLGYGAGGGAVAGGGPSTGQGGWPGGGDYERWWAGADRRMHLAGKGVLRFHAVYWPAILLSAGEPLPTDILVHDYLTIDGHKISKSAAGAGPGAAGAGPGAPGDTADLAVPADLADPAALVGRFGTDAVRWWLLREVPRVGDADFTVARLVARANDDLANGLGNLISRVVSLVHRYRDGALPRASGDPRDEAGAGPLRAACQRAPAGVSAALAAFDFRAAAAAVWDIVEEANRYLERTEPWHLARAQRRGDVSAGRRLDEVLEVLVSACRALASQLAPFLPGLAAGIAAACDDSAGRLPDPRPLFPRLE